MKNRDVLKKLVNLPDNVKDYIDKKIPKNYAGSNTTGGVATQAAKTTGTLTIQTNGVSTTTFNGSANKTLDITPDSIGASASSHTHNYAGSSSPGGSANSLYNGLYFYTDELMEQGDLIYFDGGEDIEIFLTSDNLGFAKSDHNHSAYALSSHTHNYAGSSTAGGAANSANKVNSSLTIQTNGTTAVTFNGSANKTVNITPNSIGAADATHTHNYAGSSTAGGAANSAVKLAIARNIGFQSFNGTADVGLHTMFGEITTSSSSNTNEGKWTKFASIDVSDISYKTCTGKFMIDAAETYNMCGTLFFYFRLNANKTATTVKLFWDSLTNNDYINCVAAVKTDVGKYDIYFKPLSSWCTMKITTYSNTPNYITRYSSQGYVDTITPEVTSSFPTSEIGLENYLPLSGGTLTGKIILNSNSGLNMANGVDFGAYDTSGTPITLATLTPLNIARFGTTKYETYISTLGELRIVKDYNSDTDGYGNLRTRNIYFRNTLNEDIDHIGKIESDNTSGSVTISSAKAVVIKGHYTYNDDTNCGLEYKRITNSGKSYPVLRPLTTSIARLGSTSLRWYGIYSSTAVDVGSDRRLKKDIVDIDKNLENMFMDLRPVSYKLIESDDHRRHNGFIAQEVEDSMNKHNISYENFAVLNKSMPDEDTKPKFYNENGEADYEYSLKYTELIPLNTHMIQKAFKEIEELKNKVKELEEKLNNKEV